MADTGADGEVIGRRLSLTGRVRAWKAAHGAALLLIRAVETGDRPFRQELCGLRAVVRIGRPDCAARKIAP